MKNIITSSDSFKIELNKLFKNKDFLKNEIFRIPLVRDMLTLDRFQNLFNSNILRSCNNESSEITIEHNTDFDRMFFTDLSKRPDLISNVLSSLNRVRQNSSRMKVLSVGSRTEAELFSLVNAGFCLENIECVDLFSYTPHIKIGDINSLQYSDEIFDISFCGWVLEFCNNIPNAVSELKRVTKKNGYIAIAGMHHPISMNIERYNESKHHQDRVWYCSISNIKKYFGLQYDDFVFKSDIEEEDLDKRGEVIAIFKNK